MEKVTFTPSPKAVTMGYYKKIDGVWHKKCKGPSHDEVDGVWLPATLKYFYPRKNSVAEYGALVSQCRLCHGWRYVESRGQTGIVEVYKVIHFYDEAVNRIGLLELSRRTGLDRSGLLRILKGRTGVVRKSNLRKVMLELISARRKGEFITTPQSRQFSITRLIGTNRICSGCGTPVTNYTVDCQTCHDRKLKQEKRAA